LVFFSSGRRSTFLLNFEFRFLHFFLPSDFTAHFGIMPTSDVPVRLKFQFRDEKRKRARHLQSAQSAIQKYFTVHIQRELVDLTDASRKTVGELASVKLPMIAFIVSISLPV
jgi:hypothetical protein